MIVQWLLGVIVGVIEWALGLLPDWSLPDWWASAVTSWANVVAIAGDLGKWVPLSAIANSAVFLLAVLGLALAVRVGRIALSFLTAGGGSAA